MGYNTQIYNNFKTQSLYLKYLKHGLFRVQQPKQDAKYHNAWEMRLQVLAISPKGRADNGHRPARILFERSLRQDE